MIFAIFFSDAVIILHVSGHFLSYLIRKNEKNQIFFRTPGRSGNGNVLQIFGTGERLLENKFISDILFSISHRAVSINMKGSEYGKEELLCAGIAEF